MRVAFDQTGRYPIRFGGQTGTAEGVRTWIPEGEPMLPERLARVGYECHIVGVRATLRMRLSLHHLNLTAHPHTHTHTWSDYLRP